MTQRPTTPSHNKRIQKSGVRLHLLNILCNFRSREMISELHTKCQQILRSGGTKHHKYDWGLWVYAMLTIKHKDEEHHTDI